MTPLSNKLVAGAVALLTSGAAAQALTVDFIAGTWDHACGGGGTATGWDDAYTCGSTTDGSMTATLNMSQFGTSAGHSSNAQFLSSAAFEGFLLGNVSASDDGNTGPTLTNYQQWLFTFDTAAEVSGVTITDIDEGGWIDTVGIESFSGSFLGAGLNDAMSVTTGSRLTSETGFGLEYYRASGTGNTTLDPESALTAKSNGAVDGFAIYLFNTGADTGEHGVGLTATLDVVTAPPPPPPSPVPVPASVFLMLGGLFGLGALSRRARA